MLRAKGEKQNCVVKKTRQTLGMGSDNGRSQSIPGYTEAVGMSWKGASKTENRVLRAMPEG